MRPLAFSLAALLIAAVPAGAVPLGTAFTYQGQLLKSSAPYTGSADGVFRLYDAATGGTQAGSTITITSMSVTGGLFTVDLDFGSVFTGSALWLDIQVRTPPDGGYTTLTPRIRLGASPFAMYSLNAPAGGSSQWTNSTYGIDYSAGNLGIGTSGTQSHAGRRLFISSGASNENPLWVINNNVSFATLYTANSASGGYGYYDDTSTQHYMAGRIGLGTNTPDFRSKLQAIGGTVSIWGQATGNILATGYQCGVYGVGIRGTNPQLGSQDATGVIGASDFSTGVAGITANAGNGVSGQNNSTGTQGWLGGPAIGVAGRVTNASHFGGYFENTAVGGVALKALGLAQVKTLQILGADLAESFPVEGGHAEPGTVLMLGDGSEGELRIADEPYSRRVAGVVSGANGLSAGVVLKGKSFESDSQAPVALSGRVWVKCDATRAPIHVGDLLTTADRAGHAMVAGDRDRAYGAILGKAMTSLESGRGLVLVLVSLQ
jgi:hypothetical protein